MQNKWCLPWRWKNTTANISFECNFRFLYGYHIKEREKNYITAFVSDTTEKYLCISLSPRFISRAPSCKFGICQVGFKRDSDRLSSPLSHLVSALSGRIHVRVTSTYMAKAFNMTIKQEKKNTTKKQKNPTIQQYVSIPFEEDPCIRTPQPLFQHMVRLSDFASVRARLAAFTSIIDRSNQIFHPQHLCNM